jgi:hypothetical protein
VEVGRPVDAAQHVEVGRITQGVRTTDHEAPGPRPHVHAQAEDRVLQQRTTLRDEEPLSTVTSICSGTISRVWT